MNWRCIVIVIEIIIIFLLLVRSNKIEGYIDIEDKDTCKNWSTKEKQNLKKGQKIMTDMLDTFHKLCKKHNIKYWIDAGTLIGQIRHKGWVPWDGDIDLGMEKSEYEKFVKIQDKLPDNLFLQDRGRYSYALNKIKHKKSCYTDILYGKLHQGLQVDIFVHDIKKDVFECNQVKYKKPCKIDYIYPLKEEKFEDILVYVPNNKHECCSLRHPNYMEMPDIKSRYPHEGKMDADNTCDHHLKLYPDLLLDKCPKNRNEKEYNIILKWWEKFSSSNNVEYSVAYGTMLGYIRHKKYIPWDLDMDVWIGKKDVEKLLKLEKTNPNIFFNNTPRTQQKNKIYIIINKDHNIDHNKPNNEKRERYNCNGELVSSYGICAFNGPFGRIIYNNVHCDLFVWFKSKDNHDKCIDNCKDDHCSMVPTYLGSDLPETKKIELNGNVTRIIKDDKQLEHILTLWYGKDYMIPDHKCENGKWKKV